MGPDGGATFLLLGVDQRPDETGPSRADAIILVHRPAQSGEATLLSVPRDLWLPQPDGPTNRVNTALVYGDRPDDPDAGPHHLMATLSSNFELAIDGYLLANFGGFERIVDAAGGVTIDVPAPIVDPRYPGENYSVRTIRFEAGRQTLDGERALIYVRTRHGDSDFGRTARQQQVIRALVGQMARPQNWWRIGPLLNALTGSIQTDVDLLDLPRLARLALALGRGEVDAIVLREPYVTPWVTESGAQVLLPNWEEIRPLLRGHFRR